MLREEKIGVYEAISMIAISIAAKIFFIGPRDLAETVGAAGWMVHFLAVCAASVGFLFLFLLMSKFSGQDFVSALKKVFGGVLGSLLSLLVASVILFNLVILTREFSEAVKAYFYPLTPPSFILLFFLAPALVMIYPGLKTVASTASLFAGLIAISLLSIYILAFPLYKFYNLFPLFGEGYGKVATEGLIRCSVYGDSVILAVIINSLQGINHFKKSGLKAVFLSGLFVIISFLAYNMSFPRATASENTIPALALTRAIEFGTFFQRFESIYLFIWCVIAMLAVAVNLYAVLSIYSKVFKIRDHRPMVLPMGVIVFSLCILIPDLTAVVRLASVMRDFGWSVYFGIPLLALLVAAARGKKGVKGDAQ